MGRLFWANSIYIRDPEDSYYNNRPDRLLILLAIMEGCHDYDAVETILRRLECNHGMPALPPRALEKFLGKNLQPMPTMDERLKSAMLKADKWDRFRKSPIGRIVGRYF